MRRDSGRKFLGVDAPSIFCITAKEAHNEDKRILSPILEQTRSAYSFLKSRADLTVQGFENDGGTIIQDDAGDIFTLKDTVLTCFKDESGKIYRHDLRHPASQAAEARKVIDAANAYQSSVFYETEIQTVEALIGRFTNFSPEEGCGQ